MIEIAIKGISRVRIGFTVFIVGTVIALIWLSAWLQTSIQNRSITPSSLVMGIENILVPTLCIEIASLMLMMDGFKKLCYSQGYGCSAYKAVLAMVVVWCFSFAIAMYVLQSMTSIRCSGLACLEMVLAPLSGVSISIDIVSALAFFVIFGTFITMGRIEEIEFLKLGGIAGYFLAFVILCTSIVGSNVVVGMLEFVLMVVVVVGVLKGLKNT